MFQQALCSARRWDLFVAVAAVVLLLGAIQLFAGAATAGTTADDSPQLNRTATWLVDGWYVPGEYMVNGRPDPANVFASPYVYGPAFAGVAHAANFVLGNEPLRWVSHSAGAFEVRHLVVALLAAIAVAAVGAVVALLTGAWRFGIWAAAGLLAVPAWMGQGFFNVKDIPVAAGYTLVTAALVFALVAGQRDAPSLRKRRWQAFAVGAALTAGIFISAGTRLSIWVPLAASIFTYAAIRLGQRWLGEVSRERRWDIAVGAGGVAGMAAIAAAYPRAAAAPGSLLVKSVSGSIDYPNTICTLTAGHLLPNPPPWWYLPAWFGGTLPVLIGGLAIFGAVIGLRTLAKQFARDRRAIWRRRELGLVLVLQQALLVPIAAAAKGAVMYDGVRQHLYVLPAVAILAGVGGGRLWKWATAKSNAKIWRRVVAVGLSAALIVPMVEQTLLFPYNYAYVNPIAGLGGVNDRWETDYWFTSTPETLSRVPRGVALRCSSFLTPPWPSRTEPDLAPCEGDQFWPFDDRRGTDATGNGGGDGSVWVIARKRAGDQPPDYCEQVDNVTRWLRGETVTMSYVLRCDAGQVHRVEHMGPQPGPQWWSTCSPAPTDQRAASSGRPKSAT